MPKIFVKLIHFYVYVYLGQTTSFNVASQSIDRLWGTARLATYNAAASPRYAVDAQNETLSIIKHTPPYFTFNASHSAGGASTPGATSRGASTPNLFEHIVEAYTT